MSSTTRIGARRVLAGTIGVAIAFAVFAPAAAVSTAAPSPRSDPTTAHFIAVQQVLIDLGFYRGDLDGVDGPALRAAVLAFHKATGAERTEAWGRLDWARAAAYAVPVAGGEDRFEIDLANQVAYLVRSGAVEAILGISSGNGERYVRPLGGIGRAVTPTGEFTFERFLDGLRRAPLGVLYRPWYFHGGFAVHGSPSVPAYPASHGCVRVTMWDADWLAGRLELGLPVTIFPGEPAPDVLLGLPDEAFPGLGHPGSGDATWE